MPGRDAVDVNVKIPEEIAQILRGLEASGMLERAIVQEIALGLLERGRIYPSQARSLIGLSPEGFAALLERRRIPWRYDARDPEASDEVRVSLR
jgi:predicted HTH domain antitoxin